MNVPRNEHGPFELLIQASGHKYPPNTVYRDGLVEVPSSELFAKMRTVLMYNVFWFDKPPISYSDVEWE